MIRSPLLDLYWTNVKDMADGPLPWCPTVPRNRFTSLQRSAPEYAQMLQNAMKDEPLGESRIFLMEKIVRKNRCFTVFTFVTDENWWFFFEN